MSNGYWQRLLRIDLSTKTVEVQPIEESDLRRFIGGAGLGGEILRREVDAGQDPYGPENPLIFATGPFQGPAVPGGAKFSVVSISPLTKTFGDAAAGASWGPSLKDAGYDGVWCAEYEGPEVAGGVGYRKCLEWMQQHIG